MQEEMFFCKLTFCAFKKPETITALLHADGFIRSTITISISKGENHEEAKDNVVDGSHRAGSSRSGISCSSRLLRIRGLLRFVFW
jgi:hypothetical protein